MGKIRHITGQELMIISHKHLPPTFIRFAISNNILTVLNSVMTINTYCSLLAFQTKVPYGSDTQFRAILIPFPRVPEELSLILVCRLLLLVSIAAPITLYTTFASIIQSHYLITHLPNLVVCTSYIVSTDLPTLLSFSFEEKRTLI